MAANQFLRFCFVVSVSLHGLILLQSPNFNPFTPAPKKQDIEVRYVKNNFPAKTLPDSAFKLSQPRSLARQEHFLKLDAKIITGNKIPPPYLELGNLNKGAAVSPHKPLGISKPVFATAGPLALKRKIVLPPIGMAKIDNPSYITYYQIVREKIRRSAYQNYTHNETGEVYISFIISQDGEIRDVRLIEEKTTATDYLKVLALRSVKAAAPFPNFPKELDYPQLSFNIIISFEIE